jgi:endonuclease G, mitochondrial
MSILFDQISKAKQRAAGLDLEAEAERTSRLSPEELNDAAALERRARFLRESLGDSLSTKEFNERIIHGNDLQDVNFFARGVRAARAVGRIVIRQPSGTRAGFGSGFLVAPGVLITNNHVFPSPDSALRSNVQFQYERDIEGRPLPPVPFNFLPGKLFITSKSLDFTVVAVEERSERDGVSLDGFGHIPLIATTGKALAGEWLNIIQHPDGERKQTCVRDNQLIKIAEQVLWYSTDTLAGSSGSPVFNNDWLVVALHHSGVPEEKNGRIQTIDGRDWDEQRDGEEKIKWKANEGIRISLIVKSLQETHGSHPLLQPVFNATITEARSNTSPIYSAATPSPVPLSKPASNHSNIQTDMNPHTFTVQLEIGPDNQVRLLSNTGSSLESTSRSRSPVFEKKQLKFDVPFNAKYDDRNGYQPELLGKADKRVNLPTLGTALKKHASHLLEPEGSDETELKYYNYSVVMHAKRRLAIFSAASVRGDQRHILSREDYSDDLWKPDPRIPLEHQLTNFYYRGNRFDRGHLSRNEDLEFGPKQLRAMQSAIDTRHYTNCVPQHDKFNRGKQLWQGIERHIFEKGIAAEEFHTQVITGPIFEEDDPVYEKFPEIQYPVRFWKVVGALDSKGKLFATAYILDQSGAIAEFGLDEAARDVPFGAFKTYQVKISEVERQTGLTFTSGKSTPLSEADPLETAPPKPLRRPRSGEGYRESTHSAAFVPPDYFPLDDVTDILTGD